MDVQDSEALDRGPLVFYQPNKLLQAWNFIKNLKSFFLVLFFYPLLAGTSADSVLPWCLQVIPWEDSHLQTQFADASGCGNYWIWYRSHNSTETSTWVDQRLFKETRRFTQHLKWVGKLGQIRSLSAIKRAKRELIQEALETASNRAAHISLSDVQKY